MMPDVIDEYDEILTDDKTGSQGSHGALTGLAGSQAGSQVINGDPEPEKNSNKKGKHSKASQEDDDKEPESKLARHIADALVDSLCWTKPLSRRIPFEWSVDKTIKIEPQALNPRDRLASNVMRLPNNDIIRNRVQEKLSNAP